MSNYNQAYSDISYILSSLEEKYVKKIPEELITFFSDNADPYYIPKIDITKPLTNQKMSQETELLICLLNISYWCTPQEKEELLKKYEINEKEIEEQLRNRYEIKFKEKPQLEDVKMMVVLEKENIFSKIIKFVKAIINKKKQ